MSIRYKNQNGMTLIEIMIVLGIIASLMVFGASVIGGPEKKMRDIANNLIRVISYVYNQAALNNQYYRIVFDLNEQKYFVEYSDAPFYIVHANDEIEAIRIKNEEKEMDVKPDESQAPPQAGSFAEYEDDLLQIFQLPETRRLADIYVEHQAEELTEGKVYLYFFPKGQSEFAVIHLGVVNNEDEAMTLVVNPLTAKVDIKTGYEDYQDFLNEN